MAYRRIAYAALLGGAVLFQIVFRFYLSTFTLALVLLLPLLSVLLSLPSVLGCTLLLTSAAPTVVQGEDAVFQVRLRSRTRLPLPRLQARLHWSNQLTGAGIPANNRLFDTLDTTSRLLTVSDNLDVILSDTVGFIAKLPHHLVDAFRATLEELEFADLLLHVIDASDPHLEEHIAVVDRLISQLAKPETPVLKCYNKADLVYSDDIPVGKNIVAISAKRGINMDGLLKAIESALNHARHHVVVRLPYAMGGMVETLHDGAQVKKVDYTPEGIEIEAVVDGILYGRLREYIIREC